MSWTQLQWARVSFASFVGLLIGFIAVRHAQNNVVVLWWACGVMLAGLGANSSEGERWSVLVTAALGAALVALGYALFYGLTHEVVSISGIQVEDPIMNPLFRYLSGLLFGATAIGTMIAALSRPITTQFLGLLTPENASAWEKIVSSLVKTASGLGVLWAVLAG